MIDALSIVVLLNGKANLMVCIDKQGVGII